MTLAFFMFAGRLPVLMFSFMIRTLVSFCSQESRSHNTDTRERTPHPRTNTSLEVICSSFSTFSFFRGHDTLPHEGCSPVSKPLIVLRPMLRPGQPPCFFWGPTGGQ